MHPLSKRITHAAACLLSVAPSGVAFAQSGPSEPDHVLAATPETVHWGYFSPDLDPVLTIASGDVVRVETVTAVGFSKEDPEGAVERLGLEPVDAVADLIDILAEVENEGVHILTGPIRIEGAEVGDVLEIRVYDVAVRSPFYGVNISRTTGGALPDLVPDEGYERVFDIDVETGSIAFNESIELPLAPFMGIMGVAASERVSSVPPGRYGGNMDLKEIVAGTTLYLPVLIEGGMFSTGDGHAAQGDGEVNLTAVEAPLTLTAEFILHKDMEIGFPRVETPSHYISMGLDPDLNMAAELAVRESIDFLGAEFGLSTLDAYSLTSLGVDLEVSQIVDQTKGIHAMIPKSLFTDLEDDFWAAE
ncbi:acetamidase/formamidase [Palleronia aestuarii]|uniref:Acetamidase/formamidase n=1 Tax=Palleronia aestuarii TaxID=568105 RepID=A0A2W7N110_9RHOB|nr:acetamidase/formamidase family protein [Palleronia aestuarii]PZX10564.1 acetamidase/formamidase [Palleronia aestuarii]